jgi:hypothetical protein
MQDFRRNKDIEKETVDFQLNLMIPCQPKSDANTCSYVINKWSNRYCCWYGNQYAPHNLTEVIDGTLAYMD